MEKEFLKLCKMYDIDTYGNMFSESGYGINFCFDLATALYVYAVENNNQTIKSAMETSPIYFRISPLFNFTEFLELDIDDEYTEYTTSKLIYNDLTEKNIQYYFDILEWYCKKDSKE